MGAPNPVLQPFYYHDHFLEMADFVARIYDGFLSEVEKDFLNRLQALDLSARCLYIRMANRKTRFFGCDQIAHYDEIEAPLDALQLLIEQGFVRRLETQDGAAVLRSLSRQAMITLADALDLADFKVSWQKVKLGGFIAKHADPDDLAQRLNLEKLVTPLHLETVSYLLYLYFGRLEENLSSFALRDMGLMATRKAGNFQPRFRDMAEARQGFFYQRLLKSLKGAGSADAAAAADPLQFPPPASEYISGLRSQAVFKLGRHAEARKDTARAIEIYAMGHDYPCRERLARLLAADDERERLERLLHQMIDDPDCDEEYLFASDFYARKFRRERTGIYARLLRDSQGLSMDDLHRGTPEYGALGYFGRAGWRGYHAENYLWTACFGLLFRDELFGRGHAFGGAFDFLPPALTDGSFYSRYQGQIEAKLAQVRLGQGWEIARLAQAAAEGDLNALFDPLDGSDMLESFIRFAPPAALAAMMEKMARDFFRMRDGYPDLMLVKDGQVKFVEIKAEGDQIRRNQLARLLQLKEAGFDADIHRVEYRVDPEQSYVIVDVETTGGHTGLDRVIEIGAVKVRNGKVLGEYQTLLNPARHIPQGITMLTGITNDMVRHAPAFADVANDFEAFMQGSIFAAHNVGFDYGFLSREFRRLEREFSYPKFCTCAQMRRHYPGHGSYSLANICREYGIRLDRHHRALDDAKAAAELLLLINEKRLEAEGQKGMLRGREVAEI